MMLRLMAEIFNSFMDNDTVRQDLAYAYKACSYLKLDDLTYTHLTARSSDNSFYIYPFGLLFDEVEAESLLEVDFSGQILSGEEMNYNPTGYALHSIIYEGKKDIQAVFHLHTPAIVAVSCQKDGLLPITQWALHCYQNTGYHDYNSLAIDKNDHKLRVLDDLQDNSIVMMRHHGAIIVGKSIAEALFFSYHLEKACQTQCLMGHDSSKLLTLDHHVCEKAHHDLMTFEKNLGQRDFDALKRLLSR